MQPNFASRLIPASLSSRRLIVIAYVALIFSLTHMNLRDTVFDREVSLFQADKVFHLLAFFGLTGLWLTLLRDGKTIARHVAICVLAVTSYAVFDEVSQPMFGRNMDILDWVADMTGMLLTATSYVVVNHLSVPPAPAGQSSGTGVSMARKKSR